jgi:PEP-CTERM/exosortase A-associated glycosyltransferase
MTALARRIREVVEVEKPDILHVHSPVLNALPSLRIGRKIGIPVVYEIRAFWEDAAVDHGAYTENSWKYAVVKFIETWVCRKVDQVAVLCDGLRKDLLNRGIPAEKIAVVRNGVDLDEFKPCGPQERFVQTWGLDGKKIIAFIGSFYRYEGLDCLVDAFARLARRKSNVVLLLVGGGEMEDELKKQIADLQLGSRAIMLGRVSHEHVSGIYSLADVLAYPRYSMRLTELVTPLKPIEAMAMGKALVASDVGGHRELIEQGRNGLLFPAGDVSALVEALEILLDNNTFRQQISERARDWARRKHSWDATTAEYSSLYKNALKRDI